MRARSDSSADAPAHGGPAIVTAAPADAAGTGATLTATALTLASGSVWSVTQGAQGYLWFATTGGLVVDVGAEDPLVIGTSVIANGETVPAAVTSVTPSPDKGVWIADGHLKYVSVWVDDVLDTGIPADRVVSTGDDLWAVQGSTARLVDRFSHKAKRTIALDLLDVGLTPNQIAVDRKGALYIGGQREITKVSTDGQLDRYHAIGGVSGLTQRGSGGVWISSMSGLWSLGDRADSVPVLAAKPHPQSAGVPPTAGLAELADGRVLVGLGDGGVGVFDPVQGGWIDTDNANLVTTTPVEQIFQDRGRRIWLTVADGSVLRFRDSNPYQAINLPLLGDRGAPTVTSLLYQDGSLWAALGPDGLARYDEATGQWASTVTFQADPASAGETPNISSLAMLKGELWIGTSGQGLYRVATAGGAAQPVASGPAESITDLLPTDFGMFFLSEFDEALHRVDQEGKITEIAIEETSTVTTVVDPATHPTAADETPSPITALGEGDGTLFAADSEGLFRYDPATDQLRLVTNLNAQTEWSARTNSMFVESANIVWVGTDVGVQRVDLTTGEIRQYSVDNGIPSGAVTTVVPHPDGSGLWVGTTTGIALIDLNSAEIVASLGLDQGLKSTHFLDATGTTSSDGRSFVATSDAVIVLPFARPPSQSDVEFQVRCSDGCVNDADQNQVVKDPGQLTFEFISPNAEQARGLPVEYRLEGQDRSWTMVTPDRRYASISVSRPGEYTMAVRSAIGGSVHPDTQLDGSHQTISFAVKEKWWRRTSTMVTLVAAVGVGILIGISLYTRRRRTLELQLERTVSERTAQLEESRAAAEHANRAKDRFLRAVTHDLRSPLGGVIGYAELISNTDLSDQQRRYVEAMERAGHNLFDLVEDLLFQSSNIVSSGHRAGEATPLREVVRQASRFVATHASTESMSIVEHVDSDDAVIVDSRGLKHVLINLLSNAVKYSGGSVIDISISTYGYNATDGTGTYLFSVTDDGGRLAPQVIDRIFDAGFRDASDSGIGNGLGLSMCRDWVHANGGELIADVDPGTSTTFSFSLTLPVAQPVSQAADGSAADVQEAAARPVDSQDDNAQAIGADRENTDDDAEHPLVLVVDDEAMVRGLITTMLAQLGYRWEAYDNAVDALHSLDGDTMPRVIISDLMMEPMSGEDFARQIRDSLHGGAPPIVAITGVPTAAMSTGLFDVVIGKPLRTRDLKDVLDDLAPLHLTG